VGAEAVMSGANAALWQCVFELLQAFVGNFGAEDAYIRKLRQACQMIQTSVRQLRILDVQESGSPVASNSQS
jgi:hypothetical protein